MASREASAFRKGLLQALVAELGDEWKLDSASCIYRLAPPYLLQWISLDSSRFSTDFNVSCYVQILAHPTDFWAGHVGGRIRQPSNAPLTLSVGVELPVTLIADSIRADALLPPSSPLNLQTALRALEKSSANIKPDLHSHWCRGLLLGLLGDAAAARKSFQKALEMTNDLRKAWARSEMAPAEWTEIAAAELALLPTLLDNPEAFKAHCLANSERNAASLKLVAMPTPSARQSANFMD